MSFIQSLISRSGGVESNEVFWRKLAGSPFCVRRLQLNLTLEGHRGCVNTLSFSHDGQLLVSGSDDQNIILWNQWNIYNKNPHGPQTAFRYNTEHTGNIFQAHFIGNNSSSSFSSKLISSAADGHIKLHTIAPCGSHISSQTIAGHQGMVYKLALPPDDENLIYSCGEDGVVQRIDLRKQPGYNSDPLFRCSTPTTGALKLYSIHCNPANTRQFCLGGEDECVRIFDIRMIKRRTKSALSYRNPKLGDEFITQLAPRSMWLLGNACRRFHQRIMPRYQVTCATFSQQGDVLATYNDEDIYLFSKEAVLGAGICRDALAIGDDDEYRHMSPSVYGPPHAATSSEEEDEERERAGPPGGPPAHRYNHQSPPPHAPGGDDEGSSSDENENTDGTEEGTARRRVYMGYSSGGDGSSSSSGGNVSSFHTSTDEEEDDNDDNDGGDYYYQPPRLQQQGVVQRYYGHVNRVTIKSVGFYGPNDEWIVSGSDCGHVFLWKRDDDTDKNTKSQSNNVGRKRRPDMVLKAGTEVVNCVVAPPMYSTGSSYSSNSVRGVGCLVSSGMSHHIKVWSHVGEVVEEGERKRRVVKRMKVNVERRRREREEGSEEEEEED